MTLVDGDPGLLKRLDVAWSPGMKLESKWEGPYRLTELAYQGRLGQLWDIVTGELVRVRKGVLLFAEALGARTGTRTGARMGCGKISIGTESERGENRRISGGLPEKRKR